MSANKKVYVIKVGGAFMQSGAEALKFLSTLKELQQHFTLVLVHGGGAIVEDLLSALKLPTQKIDGLRVTPKEHMPYIVGALAGTANKELCALALSAGLTPVGLSLLDGKMCIAKTINQQLGAVGTVEPGDPNLLTAIASSQMLAIISSIGADQQGNLLNINADQAATAIAQLLDAELLLLSDVPGVLDANKQLIQSLSHQQILKLTQDNIIKDGMVVKVQAAQQAANSLGRSVTIASWKDSNTLLGLSQGKHLGSTILPDSFPAIEKESA
ncbi:acetylglutamate kinase [Paraglaciecola aestuariivivens]